MEKWLQEWFDFIGYDITRDEENPSFFSTLDRDLLESHAEIVTRYALAVSSIIEKFLGASSNISNFLKLYEQHLQISKEQLFLNEKIINLQDAMLKYQQEKPKKIAKKAAQARHENSDHAKAKTEIKEKWLKQRVTIIASRGKAQFCRDMQNKYKDKDGNDLIKDTKTILTWIKNWEAELLQK